MSRLIQRCQELGVEVSVVPRMFDTINDRVGYDTVGGLPLLSFAAVDPKGLQFAVKHALDRVLALLLLIVFSPVILCRAGRAAELARPGPVHASAASAATARSSTSTSSARCAWCPRSEEAEDDDRARWTSCSRATSRPAASRATIAAPRSGASCAGTSLDELPQLFNVLRGDMSLVGPRPERPEFVELFRQDIIRYGDRHRVKSGITGWAQVHGLRGQTSLAERVEWDNYYIAHWSLGLDLKILALTFVALFRNADLIGCPDVRCSSGRPCARPAQYWNTRTRRPRVPSTTAARSSSG